MRVELTNGNWAELRDIKQLNAGDRLAVRRVNSVPTDDTTMVSSSWKDEQRVALLGQIITAWSYPGWPVPSITPNPQAAVLQIPLEDYDKFTIELDPYLEVVDYYPSTTNSGESTSTSEV